MSLEKNGVSPDLAWKTYLDGLKQCHFPALLDELPDLRSDFHEADANLNVENGTLLGFCSRYDLTTRSVLQTAWAIVISCYAGLEDVSFAYLDHDGAFPDLQRDTALICRAQIAADHTILDIMMDTMRKFNEVSAHQNYSMTRLQNLLGLEGQLPFNSGLQIQFLPASETGQATQNRDLLKVRIERFPA